MDQQTPVTSQDALKYFLRNQEKINLSDLLKDFAVSEPDGFLSFLSDLTGKTPTQVAAAIVKQRPETFMRFATGGQVKFQAARDAIQFLTGVTSQKVAAIKRIREAWGFGLKEAKDIADNLQEELYNRGRTSSPYTPSTPRYSMNAECLAAFNYIKEHA
jgi:hypothetical protein